jgi:hypothetical protein
MTIAGNKIGIGTTSPLAIFHVEDDGGFARTALSGKGGWYVKKNSTEATDEIFWLQNGNNETIMKARVDGKIAIGTTDFSGNHKLRVEGSIGAREIKVEINGWSDFVFENNYELRPLEEVEQHINEKGHLPEIPSEAEVVENGINLGEMNAKLLQKIEELTLYLIEQNKELKTQKSQNQAQQELIEQLLQEVSSLKE